MLSSVAAVCPALCSASSAVATAARTAPPPSLLTTTTWVGAGGEGWKVRKLVSDVGVLWWVCGEAVVGGWRIRVLLWVSRLGVCWSELDEFLSG